MSFLSSVLQESAQSEGEDFSAIVHRRSQRKVERLYSCKCLPFWELEFVSDLLLIFTVER